MISGATQEVAGGLVEGGGGARRGRQDAAAREGVARMRRRVRKSPGGVGASVVLSRGSGRTSRWWGEAEAEHNLVQMGSGRSDASTSVWWGRSRGLRAEGIGRRR